MAQAYTTLSAILTTVFTPPASCSSSWTYEAEYYNNVNGGLLVQNDLNFFDTSCWPASFSAVGRAEQSQIYSPGICPSGYITAAVSIESGTTTNTCCPRNFGPFSNSSALNFVSGSTLFAGCTSTYPLAYGPTVVPERVGQNNVSTTTVTGPLLMWAQPIKVEYQETDLSLFSTTSSTRSPISLTAQPSSTSAPGKTAAVSPMPSKVNNSALSTGAKAGIGVAAVVGAFILVTLLFFCGRRRRTSRSRARRPMEAPSWPGEMDELDASESHKEPDSSPLETGLNASESRRELEGSPVDSPRQSIPRKPVARTIAELE